MRKTKEAFGFETQRLRLRSWRNGDNRRFNQACNTAAVMRWLGGLQTQRQLNRDVTYFARHEAQHGYTFWVVEHLVEDRVLGICGLVQIVERDCPFRGATEIGWRIRQDDWRHGYAFEAARAVLDISFGELALSSVVSRAASENTASRRLMKKLGMTHKRALDYQARDGTKLCVYAISAEQWLDRKAR